MTTQPPTGKLDEQAKASRSRRPQAGMPRWVIAFGVTAVVLVGVFVVVHLAGGMGGMAMHH
ncbi:MAG: hypothetical protein ABI130_02065 [Leifsonia sp.]